MSAGHTIYLEELGLKPGDFVSYFAKATDNDTVPGPQTASSDIYFVQVRPFKKDYKQAQSQAQQGGGGGGRQRDVGELSRQQREIVAATFNTVRDKAEDQGGQVPRERRLPEPRAGEAARAGRGAPRQAERPARRPRSGFGVPRDRGAAAEGGRGDEAGRRRLLKAMKPDEALAPEQRALKILQDAEQQYETQIAPAERRRWRRRPAEPDGRRPGRSLRARARQAGESVRDEAAGRAAAAAISRSISSPRS